MISIHHNRRAMRGSVHLAAFGCLVMALIPTACSRSSEPSRADGAPKNREIMAPENGQAIGGYDAVSYFRDGGPRKGVASYSYRWRDATWLFATAEHRELFARDPRRYAPAYGGWCAYGMAEGYAAESDPLEAWAIHEGVLYLNWDAEVAAEWQADRANLLSRSEANWLEVRSNLQNGTAEIYWHDDE
jgi:hypothetical protein